MTGQTISTDGLASPVSECTPQLALSFALQPDLPCGARVPDRNGAP